MKPFIAKAAHQINWPIVHTVGIIATVLAVYVLALHAARGF